MIVVDIRATQHAVEWQQRALAAEALCGSGLMWSWWMSRRQAKMIFRSAGGGRCAVHAVQADTHKTGDTCTSHSTGLSPARVGWLKAMSLTLPWMPDAANAGPQSLQAAVNTSIASEFMAVGLFEEGVPAATHIIGMNYRALCCH